MFVGLGVERLVLWLRTEIVVGSFRLHTASVVNRYSLKPDAGYLVIVEALNLPQQHKHGK